MNKIFNIFAINEIMTSGGGEEYELPETGCPLHQHPDWKLINNEGGDVKWCWKDYGNIIVAQKNDVNFNTQNLCFRNTYGNFKNVEFDLGTYDFSTETWALFAAKFRDSRNLVGARYNSGKLEVVQRRNGLWSTRGSVAFTDPNKHWKIFLGNAKVDIYIDGNLELTASHQITGEGYVGISSHKWSLDETDLLMNYSIT